MAPIRPARITEVVTIADVDHARPDGLGDGGAEHERGHEVEEGRPHHGLAGLQHARRDDGGNRVGGVVKAVDVIEDQRNGDDENDEGEFHCSATRA